MAYGNGKEREGWLKRAYPLEVGSISDEKRRRLFDLRRKMLTLMREMAMKGFSAEPLDDIMRGTTLDDLLLEVQKTAQGLNSVWRERARMLVKPALAETNRHYFRRLAGGLRFVDSPMPKMDNKQDGRRYVHIPEEIQDQISAAEIAGLKGLGIRAFHDVKRGKHRFTVCQVEVLKAIHAKALAQHQPPDFGAKDDFTLQLHLDLRMQPVKTGPVALNLRSGVEMVLLTDKKNVKYHQFLDLAGAAARDQRIRLPLAVNKKLAGRMSNSNPNWASLVLELSKDRVGVRLVVGKEPPSSETAGLTRTIGRDFGYRKTVCLSVAESANRVDHSALEGMTDKGAAKSFLESHTAEVTILDRVVFHGAKFLGRVNERSERIDHLTSRIDQKYQELEALLARIRKDLGLGQEERLGPEMKSRHSGVRDFFVLLGLINDLKRARRKQYQKIAATKKCWFGFIANREVALAKQHNAAVVREDLTVEAIEKDAPGYKGRAFNRMINHGSKGQYQKRATEKMLWNGVPEIVVPSWYTSRACVTHGVVVDRKCRQGERIKFPCCGKVFDADMHAADTIASYPFLRASNHLDWLTSLGA